MDEEALDCVRQAAAGRQPQGALRGLRSKRRDVRRRRLVLLVLRQRLALRLRRQIKRLSNTRYLAKHQQPRLRRRHATARHGLLPQPPRRQANPLPCYSRDRGAGATAAAGLQLRWRQAAALPQRLCDQAVGGLQRSPQVHS